MKKPLLVIIIIFAVLAVTYSFVTQLQKGPDEPAHFIYVRSIAKDFAFPEIAHTETHSILSKDTHEGHQPPLYYMLMALPYAVCDAVGLDIDASWRIMRLFGVALGVLWIFFAFKLASLIFDSRKRALVCTAILAFTPTAAYTAGVINNDILIALLFTCAMIPIIKWIKYGNLSVKESLLLGLLMGLAALTKAQGLILAPVLLAAAFIVFKKNKNISEIVRIACISFAVCALVAGWWYIRCKLLYGTFMPHSLYNPVIEDGLFSVLADIKYTLLATYRLTVMSWGHYLIPFWLVLPFVGAAYNYYNPLTVSTLLFLLGFPKGMKRDKTISKTMLVFMSFIIIITWLSYVRYVFVVDYMASQQGRLFLPVGVMISAIALVCAEGWFKNKKALFAYLGLGLLLAANIFVIICAINYYSNAV